MFLSLPTTNPKKMPPRRWGGIRRVPDSIVDVELYPLYMYSISYSYSKILQQNFDVKDLSLIVGNNM